MPVDVSLFIKHEVDDTLDRLCFRALGKDTCPQFFFSPYGKNVRRCNPNCEYHHFAVHTGRMCQNLKDLDSCLLLSDTSAIDLTSLTKIHILGLEGLACLPKWLFSNSPTLTRLEIWGCPELRELPEGLHALTSLEVLSIYTCPKLKSIAYDSSSSRGGLTSLGTLSIADCSGLMNLSCEMVESSAPSLEELTLKNLERLMNLPMIIDCLHKMPHFRKLEIGGVPKLFMTTTSCTLCSLQELSLSPAASDSRQSFSSGVDGILQAASHSSVLRYLTLRGMEDWEALPDQIQHLTTLQSLWLHNYGIEELPEWFGHLSSLKTLDIFNCQRLRRLPSVETMRFLTNLADLIIEGCPVLNERCGIGEGINYLHHSQLPNISHIPNIYVDGCTIRSDGRTEEEFRYLDGEQQR